MTTSWKEICNKLKMNGMTLPRGGSDGSVASASDYENVTTNSSTPQLWNSRSSFDNEWQMNYMIINRKDGLPNVKKEKKPGFNSGKEVKSKVASRINTNMVKLKLLDATRKAIIDKTKKTFVSTYAQTDTFKTKLCKDQSVENQSDLMNVADATTETDVELIAYKSKDGTLIVTSTCAMNTEKIATESVSTQTVMPRSNVSFNKILEPNHKLRYTEQELSNDDDTDDATIEIMNIEKRMRKKKLSRQKSQQSSNINIVVENEASDVIASETIPTERAQKNGSDSEFEDSITEDHQPDVIKGSVKRKNNPDATFNSWHDLDFPQQKVELPKSFFSDGPTPWSNFNDLVLGQRFLNARLSPMVQRNQRPNMKQVTWSDSQVKVVTDLIKEANALMDMFDQVAMLLGPDIKLHNVSDVEDFVLPPSKYGDEMTKSCEKLEASLRRLQDIQVTEKNPI